MVPTRYWYGIMYREDGTDLVHSVLYHVDVVPTQYWYGIMYREDGTD